MDNRGCCRCVRNNVLQLILWYTIVYNAVRYYTIYAWAIDLTPYNMNNIYIYMLISYYMVYCYIMTNIIMNTPAILHGTEAIYLSNTYLANLQKEENKALRYIVNARRKTAISALRGEFGISLQSTRDMKSKYYFLNIYFNTTPC